MKAADFLEEWNKTHTSSPSLQDALNWTEQKQIEEIKEQNAEWMMTLGVQKQVTIKNACKWLEENLPYIVCKINASEYWLGKRDFIEFFRKAMEE